jgi:hypothetical protein
METRNFHHSITTFEHKCRNSIVEIQNIEASLISLTKRFVLSCRLNTCSGHLTPAGGCPDGVKSISAMPKFFKILFDTCFIQINKIWIFGLKIGHLATLSVIMFFRASEGVDFQGQG